MKKNYLNTAQDFYKIYEEQILPIFKYLEPERQLLFKTNKKKNIFYLNIAIIIYGFLTPFFIGIMMSKTDKILIKTPFFTFLFVFIFLLILCALSFKEKSISDKQTEKERNFIKDLKTKCLPKILKAFGDIEWLGENINLKDSVIKDEIEKSRIFDTNYPRKYFIFDEYKGTYKGISFKISERQECYDDGEYNKSSTNEIFILLDSNKKTKNTVIIKNQEETSIKSKVILSVIVCMVLLTLAIINASSPTNYYDEHERSMMGIAGIVMIVVGMAISIYRTKKNRIYLEDTNFEKKYNIICQDQVEARYLITPAFMERFQKIKVGFRAYKIKCSFFEDKLLIVIYTDKNLFEIADPYKSLLNPDCIKDFYSEICLIYGIIDVLKLDTKTGI